MDGQGQRDRYGNPTRQPSQTYPQGFSNVTSQGFGGSFGQGRSQAQMSAQSPVYGTQPAAQRPASQGYGGYGQSVPQFPSPSDQTMQYGGDFSTDPNRQSYSQMMGYYPQSQSSYDPLSYRGSQQLQVQTQAFPEYYQESSYGATPHPPSQPYSQPSYGQRPVRTSNPTPYTPIESSYSGFQAGSMQPPAIQPHQAPTASQRSNNGYRIYFQKLRETFGHIQHGRLAQAGPSLLEASESLLSRVEDLGLIRDDENAHEQRRKLWKEFNLCWLAFMQKLKETLESIVQQDSPTFPVESMITPSLLDTMAEKLISWADGVERWGLVDYETGIWEEEILEVACDCRTIFESNSSAIRASSSQQHPQ